MEPSNGFYGNFDKYWNGVDYATYADKAAVYKTRLDFVNGTAKLYYQDSSTPSEYTREDKVAVSDGYAAPLTTGSNYLSGLKFVFHKYSVKSIAVNKLKLVEIERVVDVTDAVVASLNTKAVTGNNNIITKKLNLPNNFAGVTVTWNTNCPDYISDKGMITAVPTEDTPVKLTAKITNNADGFTQYADFDLILSSDAVKTETIANVLVNDNKISFTLLNTTNSVISVSNVPFVATAVYSNSVDEMLDVAVVDWTEIAQKYPQIATDGVKPGEAIDVELTLSGNIGSSYKIFFWESANTLKPVSTYTSR